MWYLGFLTGCAFNLITNGPHIGCCHTSFTVVHGCLYRALETSLLYIPLYFALQYQSTLPINNFYFCLALAFFSTYLTVKCNDHLMTQHLNAEVKKMMADPNFKLTPLNSDNHPDSLNHSNPI